MTFRVVFRRAALEDFEEAASWYEGQRAGLGEEFAAEIDAAVERAADDPHRFPIAQGEIRRSVARRFPFSVYYRIRGDRIVVLAVFHARRDPSVWQRRT